MAVGGLLQCSTAAEVEVRRGHVRPAGEDDRALDHVLGHVDRQRLVDGAALHFQNAGHFPRFDGGPLTEALCSIGSPISGFALHGLPQRGFV